MPFLERFHSIRSRLAIGALLALLPACSTSLPNPAPGTGPDPTPFAGSSLAFVNTQVFDGNAMQSGWTVVIRDGLIVEAGPASTVTVPEGTPRLEQSGYTLMPGVIDGHGHLEFYDPAVVLAGGVTTIRDLGWPADRIFPLAATLEANPSAGPALLPAGPMLTAPSGYPIQAGWAPEGTGLEVGTPEAATAGVVTLATQGARQIKVAQQPGGALLTRAQLEAIVAEAHQRGLRVTSHVGSLEQLQLALEAGVDELAHGLWSNEAVPDALLESLAQRGVVWIPTLHCASSSQRVDNVRRFLAKGGTVLYGTDMGNAGPPPGIDAEELRLMVSAGMTPTAALAAATGNAASIYKLTDRGRIAKGLRADLLWLEGDPTVDLTVLSRPARVFRGGVQAGSGQRSAEGR